MGQFSKNVEELEKAAEFFSQNEGCKAPSPDYLPSS